MPFALINGVPLQRARATIPRHDVWEGTCATAGQLDLAVGSSVSLDVGDLTLSGYVVAGGTFPGASESSYTLAGGAAGWTRSVPARGLSVPSGVRLVDVVQQLAADAGERFDVSSIPTTAILGDHWQRPAGVGSVALSALFPRAAGGWRLDPDGWTRPGPRPPAPLPRDLVFAVEDAPRDRRWARIGISDDRVSAFLPGAIITAPNLAVPLVVGELTIRADVRRIVVEVLGEAGLVEMLAALVLALTPPALLTGEYRYQVVDADTGAPNLKALSSAPGLPPVLSCAKVFGLPGASATLTAGELVLLTFQDGNPARPCVSGYPSGVLPVSVVLDASIDVSLGAGGTFLSKASPTDGNFTAVQNALTALGHPAVGLVSTACTKAKGV